MARLVHVPAQSCTLWACRASSGTASFGRCLTRRSREQFGVRFEPCITEIYLHIDARMADYIRTHPYIYGLISDMHFATHFGRRPRRIEPWAKRTVQLSLRANDAGVAPRMACGDWWRDRPRVSHRCAHIKNVGKYQSCMVSKLRIIFPI